ncbi:hypothetical protein RFI_16146 [Reticulomyxa filosa]|uniref:Glycosyltransferase family 92 protein n=1 Tax=Reticulomyxa filosa TaxID=46433 RepID=X6N540_RETFI|nr:hypothetical protein RFI_16146 [Reticulomyxa filosa]|eukprot:ETO21058.1 hypothetical protein RFI_16146 [Reticulomyxa filosa]
MFEEYLSHYSIDQNKTFPFWNLTLFLYVALPDNEHFAFQYLRYLRSVISRLLRSKFPSSLSDSSPDSNFSSNSSDLFRTNINIHVYGWRTPETGKGIWYFAKELIWNDCLARHMRDYRYLMFIDIDDFIVLNRSVSSFSAFHYFMTVHQLQIVTFYWEVLFFFFFLSLKCPKKKKINLYTHMYIFVYVYN